MKNALKWCLIFGIVVLACGSKNQAKESEEIDFSLFSLEGTEYRLSPQVSKVCSRRSTVEPEASSNTHSVTSRRGGVVVVAVSRSSSWVTTVK